MGLDSSPATRQQTTYLDFATVRGRSYYVLASRHSAGEQIHLPATISISAVPGRPIVLATHPGFLGVEWVESEIAAEAVPPHTLDSPSQSPTPLSP